MPLDAAHVRLVSYQQERWTDALAEIERHWPAHYDEIALDKDAVPLAPDYAAYAKHDADGRLFVLTVRGNGELVGYLTAIVSPHLHYGKTLCAFFDLYYVTPAWRRSVTGSIGLLSMVGARLFIEAERQLRLRGVRKMFTGTKLHRDASVIFHALGWREDERLWTKVVR